MPSEESQDVTTDSLGLDTLSDESVRQLLEAGARSHRTSAEVNEGFVPFHTSCDVCKHNSLDIVGR